MFYSIPSDETIEQDVEKRLRIVFNNNEELVLDSLDNIIKTEDSIFVFQNVSTRFSFSKEEVRKIKGEIDSLSNYTL